MKSLILSTALLAISILPAAAQTAATPNQQIITDLQQLLVQAQSGQMVGFAYTAIYGAGNFAYMWEGDDTGGQIGKGIVALFAHYNGFSSTAELAAAHVSGFSAGTDAAASLIDGSGIAAQIQALPTQIRSIPPQ